MISNIALIILDVQQGLFNKGTKVYKEEELISIINTLIRRFRDKKYPIIFIRHTNKNILKEGSNEWKIHSELEYSDNDIAINKSKSNVFDEETLPDYIKKNDINTLVITGLVTHGCVKAACLGGLKRGNKVILIEDGHSSFNKKAEELIHEWNKKLKDEGVQVIKSSDLYL